MKTLYDEFIERFGEWSCAESCKIKDLPFITDIERFLNKKRGVLGRLNALVILQKENARLKEEVKRLKNDNKQIIASCFTVAEVKKIHNKVIDEMLGRKEIQQEFQL